VEDQHRYGRASTSGYLPSSRMPLKVGPDRYHILDNHEELPTGQQGQYVSRLFIPKVTKGDAGIYLCFVTNSGFGALTYHSMRLTVVKGQETLSNYVPPLQPQPPPQAPPPLQPPQTDAEPPKARGTPVPVLILVICLSTVIFILIVLIVACVCCRRFSSSSSAASSAASTASLSKSPASIYATTADVDEAQRPFVTNQHHQRHNHHHPSALNNNAKLNGEGGYFQPPPMLIHSQTHNYPTSSAYRGKVYPGHYPPPPYVWPQATTDSGFSSSPKNRSGSGGGASCNGVPRSGSSLSNQYEVPYAHMQYTSFGSLTANSAAAPVAGRTRSTSQNVRPPLFFQPQAQPQFNGGGGRGSTTSAPICQTQTRTASLQRMASSNGESH